jgi:hypothetical protein
MIKYVDCHWNYEFNFITFSYILVIHVIWLKLSNEVQYLLTE